MANSSSYVLRRYNRASSSRRRHVSDSGKRVQKPHWIPPPARSTSASRATECILLPRGHTSRWRRIPAGRNKSADDCKCRVKLYQEDAGEEDPWRLHQQQSPSDSGRVGGGYGEGRAVARSEVEVSRRQELAAMRDVVRALEEQLDRYKERDVRVMGENERLTGLLRALDHRQQHTVPPTGNDDVEVGGHTHTPVLSALVSLSRELTSVGRECTDLVSVLREQSVFPSATRVTSIESRGAELAAHTTHLQHRARTLATLVCEEHKQGMAAQTLHQRNEILTHELAELEDKYDHVKMELKKREQEVANLMEHIRIEKEKVRRSGQAITVITTENRRLEEELRVIMAEIAANNLNSQKLSRQIEQQRVEMRHVKQLWELQQSRAREEMEALRKSATSQRNLAQETVNEVGKMGEQLLSKETKMTLQSTELAQLKNKMEEVNRENDDLRHQLHDTKSSLRDAAEEVGRVTASMQNRQHDFNKKQQEDVSGLAQLSMENEALKTRVSTLEQQLAHKEHERQAVGLTAADHVLSASSSQGRVSRRHGHRVSLLQYVQPHIATADTRFGGAVGALTPSSFCIEGITAPSNSMPSLQHVAERAIHIPLS